MPFLMIRNDITQMKTDAIVNPANEQLLEGSGTSYAIYHAAGEEALTKACSRISYCAPGKAVVTKGYGLPAKYIIHAVCPAYEPDGSSDPVLMSAYTEAMKLALACRCRSIAFPLLSSGNLGYPKEKAMKAAVSSISSFLLDHEMTVYLVLYDRKAVEVSRKLTDSLKEYIDNHYVEKKTEDFTEEEICQNPENFLYEKRMLNRPLRRDWELAETEADRGKGSDLQAKYSQEIPSFSENGNLTGSSISGGSMFLSQKAMPSGSMSLSQKSMPSGNMNFVNSSEAYEKRNGSEASVPAEGTDFSEIFPSIEDTVSYEKLVPDTDGVSPEADILCESKSSREEAVPCFQASEAAEPVRNRKNKKKSEGFFDSVFPVRKGRSLNELLDEMDETFSERLLRLIDERGLKDSDVYKKANIDRRHFAKIRKDKNYSPNRATVLAFAVALRLSMDETSDLMNSAGFALSRSSRFDVIISYFIENHKYDIYEINEALFAYDEPQLGA